MLLSVNRTAGLNWNYYFAFVLIQTRSWLTIGQMERSEHKSCFFADPFILANGNNNCKRERESERR